MMKLSKSLKLRVNKARKKRGKKNGVIPYIFDHPNIEIELDHNAKRVKLKSSIQLEDFTLPPVNLPVIGRAK